MRTSFLLLLSAVVSSAPVAAETLSMHKANVRFQTIGYPVRGESSSKVLKQYGEPKFRHAPVGGGSRKTPPITRWDYEGFSVFFDAGTVIDTVVKNQPPEISHKDELKAAN